MAAMNRDARDPAGRQQNGRAGTARPRPTKLADRVRGRVRQELDARKNRVSDSLDRVAETVRRMGEPLREPPYAGLGDYVQSAAGRIEEVADDLRERSVDELVEDARDLAEHRPALFVGAALAAGLVAARFLKSSRTASERSPAGS